MAPEAYSSIVGETEAPQPLASKMQKGRTPSPSPSDRLSISSKISAFGAKLSRTLSSSVHDQEDVYGEENDSVAPILPQHYAERSTSRNPEAFQSTGRGGIGNIRQASASRHSPSTGPDDYSDTRGRELIANPNQIFSTGRGGSGNLRSPSLDPKPRAAISAAEKEVIRDYVAANEGAVYSSGRGGLGNMTRPRSRDPTTITPPKFSTGRGGAGNIIIGDGHLAESIDDGERRMQATGVFHSTGRGGAANITSIREPAIEHHPHHQTPEFESTGRGGVGNIVGDRRHHG